MYDFLLERSSGGARLVQAARRGDRAAISALLVAEPMLLSQLPGATICDALCGDAETTRLLLERGADPDARDDGSGATALHHAAWRALPGLAEALLDGGADPLVRDREHSATPLGWAHHNNRQGMVAFFLARNAPDLVDAAWLGDVERVREILDARPELVDGPDDGRLSPLRSAAWCGHAPVVALLLERGADPSVPHEETGETALDFAREQGHADVVKLLSGS
jgi:ankyrin repeat protein